MVSVPKTMLNMIVFPVQPQSRFHIKVFRNNRHLHQNFSLFSCIIVKDACSIYMAASGCEDEVEV
jgi:hypothetical protein